MKDNISSFHQIGKFIYLFQIVERQIEEIIVLIADADDVMVQVLLTGLEFSAKLKAADVMFSRFVDVKNGTIESDKNDFHKCITATIKLAERRNEIVHSKYYSWLNIEGRIGLLRQNSRLRSSKGVIEDTEEELLPEAFTEDLGKINEISNKLEAYRLKIIDVLSSGS